MANAPTVRTARGSRLSRGQRANLHGYLLSAPSYLAIAVVILIPFFAVVVFAFADFRLIDIPRLSLDTIDWTLDNVRGALGSTAFWSALSTTLLYAAFTTVGVIAGGVIVALAMRKPFRGQSVVRALFLVPYVLPVIAAATIWRTMLNPQYGIVNAFGTQVLGWSSPIAFLTTKSAQIGGLTIPVALIVVILFEIWKSAPFTFLFVTARLQNVPAELEDAAAIDGANAGQRLAHIVLPQLRTVVMVLVLLRFIWSFQNFNDIYLLTQGAGGTEVMAVKVFKELTVRADVGSAAAYGLWMTAILLVFGVLWALANRRKEAM
ncbi:MAG TPA: sugar ABC transporter permease [Actinotalea caeni]|uniref:carbohydrate ABC transporter permease n=1 Tax=Actinotalea caeni TaxID=1348467 RepID=UPI002B4AB044|nr:sugar ABC transporter permease [Actinotalea caeni]HLV56910.1 sugar ABC transporter permease [Actinotalea caeni]